MEKYKNKNTTKEYNNQNCELCFVGYVLSPLTVRTYIGNQTVQRL